MNIMVIDDDRESRINVCEFLRGFGHRVIGAENGQQALNLFMNEDFNLILSDIKMPRISGIELMRQLNSFKPERDFDIVLFTGYGDMESAIEAIRNGARDYLLKPINIEQLANIIERVAETQAVRSLQREATEKLIGLVRTNTEDKENKGLRLSQALSRIVGIGEIGTFSKQIREIYEQASQLHYDREIPVLIQGETGTGKEIIARIVHYCYSENEAPFVDINCATLTPGLFESELFGYESGAYTGALAKGCQGKIDLASGGTLFLDEIGEISVDLQAKLLRSIQEKAFYRVGGLKKIKSDARIICATNVDLDKKVEEGLFRADLFYRLSVARIVLPPLRERKEEILPLTQMFLTEFAGKKGKKFSGINDKAAEMLTSYKWPGNVRELRNVIEWAVFLHNDIELKPAHLGAIIQNKKTEEAILNSNQLSIIENLSNFSLPEGKLNLEELCDKIIARALEMHKGNKVKTAKYLGITRRALYGRLERMGRVAGEKQ